MKQSDPPPSKWNDSMSILFYNWAILILQRDFLRRVSNTVEIIGFGSIDLDVTHFLPSPLKHFLGAWCGLFSAIHIKSWRKHKSWPLTLSLLEIGRISDPLRTSGRSSSSIQICMFVPRNEALGLVILLQIHPKITGGVQRRLKEMHE